MDRRARALSPFGPEKPRTPPSLEDDELFHQFFDWYRYSQSSKSLDHSSSYPGYPSPPRPGEVVDHIPGVIQGLEGLRMKTSYARDDEATNSSVYSGRRTTPELVQGDSASPSDHSGSTPHSPEYSYYGSNVSLGEVQSHDDQWTYPQAHMGKSGHSRRAQTPEDYHRQPFEQAVGSKRRRSPSSQEKRHRHLADSHQTADVRKIGACLPCRVSKTRCHESGVCPTCRKAFPDHSHLACIRLTPIMAYPVINKIPDFWSRDALEEEQLCSEPRFYAGKPRKIHIFFSNDQSSAHLQVTVQGYHLDRDHDDGSALRKAAFPRDMTPSHGELQMWAEGQIQREHHPDYFQRCVQTFLFAYAEVGKGLPKHGLVSKVHRMNCFFKIWKTSSFTCRDPTNKYVTLPLSVQAQLRNIARKALDSLEYDVLKELDECISHQGPPKSQDRIAIWASMWQLMLIYRELFEAFKAGVDPLMTPGLGNSMMHPLYGQYRALLDTFLPLLAVFYHYQFRTKKSLDMSMSWLKASVFDHKRARQIKFLQKTAEQLVDSRWQIYKTIQSSQSEIDHILSTFVVTHEVKKLNARSRVPKTSSRSRSRVHVDDDYDDE